MGMVAGGLARNREYRKNMVDFDAKVPDFLRDIFFDPQTSGGLLIAVPEAKAPRLLEKLHREGVKEAAVIGRVVGEHKGRIRVQ
jgi:selenide,water dikinase